MTVYSVDITTSPSVWTTESEIPGDDEASCVLAITTASILSACVSACLSAITFASIQIILCKCHSKFKAQSANNLDHDYAVVTERNSIDTGNNCDHTYDVVGEAKQMVETKSNESYGVFK